MHLISKHVTPQSSQCSDRTRGTRAREEVLLGKVFDMLSGIKSLYCILLVYVSTSSPGMKALEIV